MENFSKAQFEAFRSYAYQYVGISLGEEKKETLKIKIVKQMMRHNIDSFDDYYDLLVNRRNAIINEGFVNEITTNKTEFFRENAHFDFLSSKKDLILSSNPRIIRKHEIRAWSAACSTGQEPYTLAMTLLETMDFLNGNIKILATDINTEVLLKAIRGFYPYESESEIEKIYLLKYFTNKGNGYIVKDAIKRLITFRLFNLMSAFPFKNQFDIIFCRNVMIYFDQQTQERLVNKFYDVLAPGGLLIVGLSETLNGKEHRFKYVQPTIYIK